jgi:1-acyl-sn-glycerol-3-phosphate acyltransferase
MPPDRLYGCTIGLVTAGAIQSIADFAFAILRMAPVLVSCYKMENVDTKKRISGPKWLESGHAAQALLVAAITKTLARLRIWASYLAMVAAGFVFFLFFRFPFNFTRVHGRKNIPPRGERVLFISNHTTMYDSFLIAVAAYFPKIIFYPSLPFINFAARENFFRTRFFKMLFTLLRTVPVERRDHPWLMRKYVEFLQRNNLLIFYQGTRTDDLYVIKNGPAFAIAHAPSPITVIPVYHQGIERIFTKGGPKTRGLWRWLPRSIFRCPVVIFGQPIDFSECFRIRETRSRIAAINQRIVASIVSLKSLASCPGQPANLTATARY